RMRHRRALGARAVPVAACAVAALLAGGCEEQQEPQAASRAEQRGELAQSPANEGSARLTNAGWRIERTSAEGEQAAQTVVVIPGPDGSDGLRITRQQPAEVRAGQTLRYTIEVENASETVLRDIVVEEWR